MKSREKGIDTFKQVLARLSRGEIVQNRQVKTVLGAEGYARYLSDCEYQQYLRLTVKNKPDEILGYERRLKAATFAYSKADYRGQKGHHSAKKVFAASDTKFERLAEYWSENIVGHYELEIWFDRPVAKGVGDSFGVSPDGFPQIIASKILKNTGGVYVDQLRTIREVKIDAVKAILEELASPKQETVVDTTAQMARLKRLRKLSSD